MRQLFRAIHPNRMWESDFCPKNLFHCAGKTVNNLTIFQIGRARDISYEFAFKRSPCWFRRRLLGVLLCRPASPPPHRLVFILNASPYQLDPFLRFQDTRLSPGFTDRFLPVQIEDAQANRVRQQQGHHPLWLRISRPRLTSIRFLPPSPLVA